jgi:hypothetical protein
MYTHSIRILAVSLWLGTTAPAKTLAQLSVLAISKRNCLHNDSIIYALVEIYIKISKHYKLHRFD